MQGDRKEITPAKKTKPRDTLKFGVCKFVFAGGEAMLKLLGIVNANGRKAKTAATVRISHPVIATKSLFL